MFGHDDFLVSTGSLLGGTQHIFKFPNGYGASVVRHQYSYGGPEGRFEVAVLDDNGIIDCSTPITSDVLGWLEPDDVSEFLDQIKNLEPSKKAVVSMPRAVPFNTLVGKTVTDIKGLETDAFRVTFKCADGSQYLMYHEQDCCEYVSISDICGDVYDLIGSPILQAEETTSFNEGPRKDDDGSFTWTFYKLATVNGYVTIRRHGVYKPRTSEASQPATNEPTPPLCPSQELKKRREDHKKEFLRVFGDLTYRHSPWEVWQDFVTMIACSFSNAVDPTKYDEREALYMSLIKKYSKKEQNLFPDLAARTVMALEENPEQDFLGAIYMELGLGNKGKAQIFTPYSVCDLLAQIVGGDVAKAVEAEGYIAINDPCCGSGATLIAGIHQARRELDQVGLNWQNHVLIVAQDIDQTVALMCYIQISLLGAAAYVKIGNSLTEPITTGDSKENYWFTPMYFSQTWVMRRIFRGETF